MRDFIKDVAFGGFTVAVICFVMWALINGLRGLGVTEDLVKLAVFLPMLVVGLWGFGGLTRNVFGFQDK